MQTYSYYFVIVFIKFTFSLSRWISSILEMRVRKTYINKKKAVYTKHRISCTEKRPSWDYRKVRWATPQSKEKLPLASADLTHTVTGEGEAPR